MASNGAQADALKFFNYPDPKSVNIPYKSPDAPKNPVVRGLPLYYGASLVSSVGFIQTHLWNNTGFNRLRGRPELEDVAPRYDPTVIPLAADTDKPPSADATTPTLQHARLPAIDANGRFHSVFDYHDAYKAGRTTPTTVIEVLLPLIRRNEANKPTTPHSTAWVELREDLILAAAAASTERYKAGKPLGVLDGIPVSVKDEVDVTGYKKRIGTTKDHSDGGRCETSFCVQQWEAAGAIVVGKTTMHELGMDTTNNNPNHGTPLNPYNSHYYTGGSSGGSGYAVGAGLLPFALGADGGGSIRIPANYCGVYGLKTSHGRVSGRPTPSLAASTGVLGPIAANVADLEIAYRVMAVPDALHASSSLFAPSPRSPSSLSAVQSSTRPKILGICEEWLARADPPVRAAIDRAIENLVARRGYTTLDIHIPLLAEGQSAHALTILSEIASGHPDTTGLTPANKVLISVGSRAGAVDLLQAQKVRTLLMQHLAHLYRQHPGLVIVTPTTPNAGWHISGGAGDLKYGVSDGNMSIRNMEYVWLANFVGCPALSAPVGYVDPVKGEGKVPVSLMGMSEWGSEDTLLGFGYDVEDYLNGSVGGRERPGAWVDVLKSATE